MNSPPRKLGILAAILTAAACAPQDVGPASGKARFPDFPNAVFDSFRATCDGPTREFASPRPDVAECREFLPPEPTAALMLRYDGTLDALPRLVIRFEAAEDDAGVVLSNSIFVTVPQRSGPPRHVPYEDATLRRALDTLYIAAGGVPEP